MGDLAFAEGLDFTGIGLFARLEDDPGGQFLTVFGIGHPEDLHLLHLGVAVEIFLHFAGIDVLPTPDDHVLDPPHDVAIAFRVQYGQVAGVHPALAIHGFPGALLVVPIALHHRIAPGAKLALCAHGKGLPLFVHDFHLHVGMHPSHGGDPFFQAVVHIALKGYGAGFGHAISDGDLVHVQVGDHPPHDFDRAGRAGHDPGAQGAESELAEIGMLQHGHEHGGHAIQAGAALVLERPQGVQRIEAFAWKNHGGALVHAAQRAHHHAEAMVERHGNAEPVLLGEFQGVDGEQGVVDNVAVGEGGALGRAGGAAGELDIDRLLRGERIGDGGQLLDVRVPGQGGDAVEIEHARAGAASHADHGAQMGQPGGLEPAWLAAFQLRRQGGQHFQVVAGLEGRGQHQGLATHLVEGIFQFHHLVSRVDVDQDHPGPRGGVLGEDPFGAVGGPDSHPVAFLQSQRQQPRGQGVDPRVQFPVAPAEVLPGEDHRLAFPMQGDRAAQQPVDGELQQGFAARSGHMGQPAGGQPAGGLAVAGLAVFRGNWAAGACGHGLPSQWMWRTGGRRVRPVRWRLVSPGIVRGSFQGMGGKTSGGFRPFGIRISGDA